MVTTEVEDKERASDDAAPEKPEPFQLIWHGDSRVRLATPKLKGQIDCIITDPPFGVDNKSNMAVTAKGKEYARKIANDETPEQAIKVFKEVMNVTLPNTAEDCDMYLFTAHQVLEEWLAVARWLQAEHGFKKNALLVWEKDGPGMGDVEGWGMGHEIVIFLKKGRKPRYGPRRNGVIHIPQIRPDDLIHPHEKPTALLELFLRFSTRRRDFVVDPFGGSGSLARAARNVGRSALCVEYDEMNYQLAKEKFEMQGEGMF